MIATRQIMRQHPLKPADSLQSRRSEATAGYRFGHAVAGLVLRQSPLQRCRQCCSGCFRQRQGHLHWLPVNPHNQHGWQQARTIPLFMLVYGLRHSGRIGWHMHGFQQRQLTRHRYLVVLPPNIVIVRLNTVQSGTFVDYLLVVHTYSEECSERSNGALSASVCRAYTATDRAGKSRLPRQQAGWETICSCQQKVPSCRVTHFRQVKQHSFGTCVKQQQQGFLGLYGGGCERVGNSCVTRQPEHQAACRRIMPGCFIQSGACRSQPLDISQTGTGREITGMQEPGRRSTGYHCRRSCSRRR